MNNNSMSECGCNDYALQTANTGVGTVSAANSNLDGSGTLVTILTPNSAAKGAIVRSIVIKAIQQVTEGMVRLFIKSGTNFALIREIPIEIYPALHCTPTPPPLLPVLEIGLPVPILLQPGQTLVASTQTNQSFNIIAEGVDWVYPDELPPVCCNFMQEETTVGVKQISTANTNLNGTGTITKILDATDNGTLVNSINIAALNSTKEDIVRFFIWNGTTYFLWMEVVIPPSTQASFIPSFKIELSENFKLQAGFSIAASTNNGQLYAITIQGTSWSYPI